MSPNQPIRVVHPIEMISAYMDGRLEAADRTSVHDHLRDCAACQAILADFRALAAAARREEAPPIPAYLLEKIGRQIDADSETRPALRRPFLLWARLPLASAAAVLVLATLWVVWRGRPPVEDLAESRANAVPPIPDASTGQARPTQPQSAPAPAAGADQDRPAAFAPSPPARRPDVAGKAPMDKAAIKKEDAAPGGAVADSEAYQMGAIRTQEALPAPEGNLARPRDEAGESTRDSRAGGPAPAAAVGGVPKAAEKAGPTVVFVLPEARVSVLPGSRVVLTSGDYICALPAGGQDEVKELAELRALAARQPIPMTGELVIPAPPEDGPLDPEVAAEMHRRLRILARRSLLPRAEAECGPLPPGLEQIR